MGDISTWNPVDNSNTTAPPDGWPEGMAPSAVNNSARAMMGAVRRWYDTVTAQVAGMLPLAGGTMTGALHAPFIHSTGNVQADNGVTSPSMIATGTIQAAQLTSTGNINATSTITGSQLTSTGGINATLDVGCRHVNATGTLGGAYVHSTGNVQADNAFTGGSVTVTGNVTGANFIGNVSVPGGGTLSTTGTVTGGQVTSTGNMNASGSITADTDLIAGNNIHAGNKIFAQSLEIDVDAYLGTATINNGLQVTNGTCWNLSGSWTALSDAALKDDIAPYRRGLDAVLALNPVSFRYRPEVFGDDSARIMQFGLVADEVAPLVPEMVGETMLGDRAVSTLTPGHLVFCLINAAKDLAAQNAALAARITALEGDP